MPYRDPKTALRALSEIAAAQGGYFTARQAAEAGYGSSHLRYHLAAGNFERVGHGIYRIPTAPLVEHDDLLRLHFWSRDREDRPQAVVSHQTALSLHDLAEFIPTRVHLTVPPSFRKPAPKGCILHKAMLEHRDTQEVSALRVTTPLRTLRDLAEDGSMPSEQFGRAVDQAASRGLIGRAEAKELRARRRTAMPASRPKRRTA